MNGNYPPSTYCLRRKASDDNSMAKFILQAHIACEEKASDDNSMAKFILQAHVCAHEPRTHRKDKREKKTQLVEVKPRIEL